MHSSAIISLFAAAIGAAAFESFDADSSLERRFPYAGGGWGAVSDPCPADTFVVDGGGGYQRCCPNGMEAPDVGLSCCVGNLNCGDALQATPFCADSTWTLWGAGGIYFCCLPGQIGIMGPNCVSGTTEVAATLSGEALGQPTPFGLADGALGGSSASGALSTPDVTGASATQSSSTTTIDNPSSPGATGGIGGVISGIYSIATAHSGVISGIVSGATQQSKSDAVALSPIDWKVLGSSITRGSMLVAGLLGLGLVFLYT